ADGLPWIAAGPEDGAWGAPVERFRASLPTLASGPHTVEARAIDDHGNVDAAPGSATVVVSPGSDPLGDTVRLQRIAGGGVTLLWTPCAGAATYRIYRATAAAGPFLIAAETSLTTWDDPSPGAACYEVRPVDACGDERSD